MRPLRSIALDGRFRSTPRSGELSHDGALSAGLRPATRADPAASKAGVSAVPRRPPPPEPSLQEDTRHATDLLGSRWARLSCAWGARGGRHDLVLGRLARRLRPTGLPTSARLRGSPAWTSGSYRSGAAAVAAGMSTRVGPLPGRSSGRRAAFRPGPLPCLLLPGLVPGQEGSWSWLSSFPRLAGFMPSSRAI